MESGLAVNNSRPLVALGYRVCNFGFEACIGIAREVGDDILIRDIGVIRGVFGDEGASEFDAVEGHDAGCICADGVAAGVEFRGGEEEQGHQDGDIEGDEQQNERQGGGLAKAGEEFHLRGEAVGTTYDTDSHGYSEIEGVVSFWEKQVRTTD